MNPEVRELLAPFYFGAITESDRLKIEQELLMDTEVLVDYLDLKRKIESAQEIPTVPPPSLWLRLHARIKPRRQTLLVASFAIGIAASLFIAALFFFKQNNLGDSRTGHESQILFDSGGEPSASANVL